MGLQIAQVQAEEEEEPLVKSKEKSQKARPKQGSRTKKNHTAVGTTSETGTEEPDRRRQGNKKEKDHESEAARGQSSAQPDGRSPQIITAPKSELSHLKLCKPTSTPVSQHSDLYSTFASPLLSLSDRKQIISFEQWSAELEPHFAVTKIAEASFSEVYRLAATSTADGSKQESVLKIVALKTPPSVPLPSQLQTRVRRDRDAQVVKELAEREEKDQWKSHVADVLSEVKLLQNLNHIPGFTVFRDLTVVQGKPSPTFSKAWTSWNKSRPRGKKSEFPDPTKKASYDDMQLWAIVEMQDAGTDCEKIMELDGLASVWEIWDVFWGVCLSVAKAEEACRFEHRDLHLGNICVRSSKPGNDATRSLVQDPLQRKLHFTGLETTVIDYTLSRADIVSASSRRSSSMSSVSNPTWCSDSSLEPDVAYLDLNNDPALFEGDASEEYQYEIYRYMRDVALHDRPLLSNTARESDMPSTPRPSPRKNTHIHFDEIDSPRRSPRKHNDNHSGMMKAEPTLGDPNVWKKFHPKTNLVWAHYLLHKLLSHVQAQSGIPDQLSVEDIVAGVTLNRNDDPQRVKRKAIKLHKILRKVNELLCPAALSKEHGLGSMKELVVLALEERWLRVDDVAG